MGGRCFVRSCPHGGGGFHPDGQEDRSNGKQRVLPQFDDRRHPAASEWEACVDLHPPRTDLCMGHRDGKTDTTISYGYESV